jgi:His/Glu/Gln/Arg/opine family amino acid ABC transporter permease subunit
MRSQSLPKHPPPWPSPLEGEDGRSHRLRSGGGTRAQRATKEFPAGNTPHPSTLSRCRPPPQGGRIARPSLLLTILAALSLAGCATRSSYSWGWYVISPALPRGLTNLEFLVSGLWATIAVSAVALAASVPLGAIVGIAGTVPHKGLRAFNRIYVELLRSVPSLVMVLWVYYGLPVVFGLEFGVFTAGVLALAISDSAFQAEIFRAGIQSVEKGQAEGALSLGLSRLQVLRFIILPQAFRRILPALGNQFVYMLKMSSILSIIGYQELTRRANELVVTEYRPLEIYTFLVVEYLILIVIASFLMRRLETLLNRPFQERRVPRLSDEIDVTPA